MTDIDDPLASAAVDIPPVLRPDMVEKAIHFLQDPKVTQTPVSYQKAFLQKKGLTEAEIDEAYRKVPVKSNIVIPTAPPYTAAPPYPPYPPQYPMQPPRSSWRDIANVAVLAGGATYLTVNFVKNYVLPRFFGVPTAQQQQFNVVQENLAEVQTGLKFLVDSVQQTVTMVQQQQEVSNRLLQQLTSREDSARSLEKAVAELKSEMSVVKSLLLSRDQFPPLPQIKPVASATFPSWQQNGTTETPKKFDRLLENGDVTSVPNANEGSPV